MSSTTGVQVEGPRFDLTAQHDQDFRVRHSQSVSSHGQFGNSWFQGGLPTPPGTKDMTGVSINGGRSGYPSTQSFGNGFSNGTRSSSHTRVASDPYASQYVARQKPVVEPVQTDSLSNNSIASHLQIPESVNSSKGSLAEFAAETAATLEYAASLPTDASPDRGLVPDAIPSLGFRKWVTTMLSTTQVGKNVILLALMFVYRLKKFNPSVSGKRGSEFRLLTIALMLGNKFLDDNTYTNKTWAEVSGISVSEIHIMEVEFLSNMRYELYASKEDWAEWKTMLNKFGSYYEKAMRFVTGQPSPQSNPPITPTNQTFGYKLPSPPSKHNGATQASYNLPNPMTTLPQLPRSPARAYPQSALPYERKRSLDSSELLPPAKRLYQPSTQSGNLLLPTVAARPTVTGDVSLPATFVTPESFLPSRMSSLPMPRVAATNAGYSAHLAPLSLPPNKPSLSAYPPTAVGWTQPITPISAIPVSVNNQYLHEASPAPDAVKASSRVSSAHTSPVDLYGPSTPTRQGLSPSYFLTNRSSPYRPVRNVHTLLIPPPSATMQHTTKNIPFDQMHYQPLGRPFAERRPGPVPFHFPDGRQQSAVSTPVSQFQNY